MVPIYMIRSAGIFAIRAHHAPPWLKWHETLASSLSYTSLQLTLKGFTLDLTTLLYAPHTNLTHIRPI